MQVNERSMQGDFLWGQKNVMRCQIRYPQLDPGEMPGCESQLSLYYTMYARERWAAEQPLLSQGMRQLPPADTLWDFCPL